MKIQLLKENEPLEIIEVSIRERIPDFFQKNEEPRYCEWKQIQMRVVTDGEIDRESEVITRNIDEYYIGKKKYQYNVETLKSKNLYFKNHSYVITYLIAKENGVVGKIGGWFDVIKEVSIYLENPKDKKALKEAKKVIEQIKEYNRNGVSSSVFNMLFSSMRDIRGFEEDLKCRNVYVKKK